MAPTVGDAGRPAQPATVAAVRRGGHHLVPRRGGQAEGPRRRGRVDDELLVELVPDRHDLAHHRDDDADRPQDRPRDAGHRSRGDAQDAGEVAERLPLRARRVAGHVPRAAERTLVRAEGRERRGDVGHVRPAPQDIRVTDDVGAAALAQRRQLADQVRVVGRHLRADEVRGAGLGDPHATGLVRGERVGPHPDPDPALDVGGGQRRLRGHRARTGGRTRRGSTSSPGRRRCARQRRGARPRPAASRWPTGGRPG